MNLKDAMVVNRAVSVTFRAYLRLDTHYMYPLSVVVMIVHSHLATEQAI